MTFAKGSDLLLNSFNNSLPIKSEPEWDEPSVDVDHIKKEKIESDGDCALKGVKKEIDEDETNYSSWISNTIVKEEIIIEDSFGEETAPDRSDRLEECPTCSDFQKQLLSLARQNARVEFISLTQSFESHKLFHATSSERKLSCKECGERFAWAKEAKKHKLAVHGCYKCELCHKQFLQRSHLGSHKKARHKVVDVYNCDSCAESFFALTALVKHSKTHETSKSVKRPFRCDVCKKTFVADFHLKNHRDRFHSRRALKDLQKAADKTQAHKRVLKCDACGESFATVGLLKRHKFVHMRMPCVKLGKVKL